MLVLGASGWLGRAVVQAAPPGRLLTPSHRELDLTDTGRVASYLCDAQPRAVINLVTCGTGAPEPEQQRVHAEAPAALAQICQETGVRLIQVSSDMVFDGERAPYGEHDPVGPRNRYGRSKAAGESLVLEACDNALCVRTSLIWDRNQPGPFLDGVAQQLAAGKGFDFFDDEIRCPMERPQMARALLQLTDADCVGALHVTGRQAISRAAMGLALLEHFEVPHRERAGSCMQAEVAFPEGESRPRDLRLRVSRAEAVLGWQMPGFDMHGAT